MTDSKPSRRAADLRRSGRSPLASPDSGAVLAWYDRHARTLPWRVGPKQRADGSRPDPYKVWLSEIMLQQTTVAAVKPYYETFIRRWPDIAALADAPREEVMKAWAGLGYYARARNLKACAERLAADHSSEFPDTVAALRALPGIGDYTAAAIAAIAFDRPAAVVDGNIERVIARLFAIDTPLPAAKPIIRDIQAELTPRRRAGDYAQALMDLGATICTVKRPACALCPWKEACAAHAAGTPEAYPLKVRKAERPVRHGAAFVAVRADGAILLRRRAEQGLLGGMAEAPGSTWTEDKDRTVSLSAAPLPGDWRRLPGVVTHVFTHFRLEIVVYRAGFALRRRAPTDMWWSPSDAIAGEALPSVMRKIIEAAVPGATKRQRGRAA